uniref:F-box/LRR-repeat protein 15 n=3 Tax=Cacopsylla melanoneura TaxID=428564 RepID=A0A8D8LZF2_9HEMI
MESKPPELVDLLWNDVIFQYIFPLLSMKDLYQLRATNKSYKELVEEYLFQLKSLHLHSEQLYLQKFGLDAFQVLSSCCSNLRKVNFTACSWLTDEVLISFFTQNKHITDVNLSLCINLTSKCLQPLIVHAKPLQVLKLNNCTWFTSGCLEALTLHQPYLESIDLSNTSIGDQNAMNMFLKKSKRLKKIHVENVQIITDTSLFYIGQHCPLLTNINIRQNFHVTEKGIRFLLSSCKKLDMVYLRLCPSLSYNFIREISKQVRVDKCNVTNEFFTIVKFPTRQYNLLPADDIL